MVTKTWRQIARVLTPCCLVAGCASVPELPAVTATHPAHPDAQAALLGDRPSILDAMAMDLVPQPDAMGEAEMDHSHHDMSMGEEQQEPPKEPDDGEDNGPSDHGGDDES